MGTFTINIPYYGHPSGRPPPVYDWTKWFVIFLGLVARSDRTEWVPIQHDVTLTHISYKLESKLTLASVPVNI